MTQTDPIPGGPLVVQTQGYTPQLWRGESVIFIANLMAMFFGNEEQTELMKQEITGAETYGARLLPIMGLLFEGGDNLLLLECMPDPALVAYFRDNLALNLPRIEAFTHQDYVRMRKAIRNGGELPFADLLERMRIHPAGALDGFVTDETVTELARRLGKRTLSTQQASMDGNNKLHLYEHMKQAGLPVFDTRLAESPEEVPGCLRELAELGYDKAIVKSQIGASGVGLLKLPTTGEIDPVPKLFFHEGPCMVQGWVRPGLHDVTHVYSPSVQMFLNNETVYLYDLTEQILSDDSVHQGNESPPPYLAQFPGLMEELFKQAEVAGLWLHGQGYRGTASIDFLVAALREPGARRVYSCEINARVTGATYPSILGRHYLPRGGWLMRNLEMKKPVPGIEILSLLMEHGHLFYPQQERGILPINFNPTKEGLVAKGQFLCLGPTSAACHDMLLKAEADLPIDWTYVRD